MLNLKERIRLGLGTAFVILAFSSILFPALTSAVEAGWFQAGNPVPAMSALGNANTATPIVPHLPNPSAPGAPVTTTYSIYLPFISKAPTPRSVYLPLIGKAPPAASTPTRTPTPIPNPIANGGFEQPYNNGPWFANWNGNGVDLRTDRGTLAKAGVSPRSGDYAAWLGGTYSSQYDLLQQITIPSGGSTLRYWTWIQSDEPVCDISLDQAWVFFITSTQNQAETYSLCTSARTSGWVKRDVDLSSYAGQTGWLDFTVRINGANSNLFIDDVQLGTLTSGQFKPVIR